MIILSVTRARFACQDNGIILTKTTLSNKIYFNSPKALTIFQNHLNNILAKECFVFLTRFEELR